MFSVADKSIYIQQTIAIEWLGRGAGHHTPTRMAAEALLERFLTG